MKPGAHVVQVFWSEAEVPQSSQLIGHDLHLLIPVVSIYLPRPQVLTYNIQLLKSIETTYKLSHVVQMRLFTQVSQLAGQFSQ